MKRTLTTPPLLSFCLIARNCAATVETTLKSIRERAPEAEIVVVDTCSSDETPSICQRYADVWEEYKGPNGTWNREMYAFDDAAAARNRSFELAQGKWLCWIDTDDELLGGERAQKLLELNGRWKPPGGSNRVEREGVSETLEDFLRAVDEKYPQLEGFWCPYLYRSDESGQAITWQVRERIVRNNGNWVWRRKAHEVLVAVNPNMNLRMASIPHLLFFHLKKFTDQDSIYSLQRHQAILMKDYDAGARICQDLLYLENYAVFTQPQRRGEFIREAYECAFTAIDRARVLVRAGNLAAENGFFLDSLEHFSAAAAVAPDYPDSYFACAIALEKAEQYLAAAGWFQKGLATDIGHPFSDVTPKDHAVTFRARTAMCLLKAAKQYTASGAHAAALGVMEAAVLHIREAHDKYGMMLGQDAPEMAAYVHLLLNERDALLQAQSIHSLWKFLVSNEESVKAVQLLQAVPHNLQNHPLMVEIETWAKKIQTHLSDSVAYKKFYEDIGTDITSDEKFLDYDTTLPRVRFIIDQIAAWKPDASILEVGPFDGITAIPVMKKLPKVRYTGIEVKESALKILKERVQRMGMADRFTGLHAMDMDDWGERLEEDTPIQRFDAIIFCEVIEHVQDPVQTLQKFSRHLNPGGRLFVSTPWGAFDRGHPASPETRDARGHVRAMMPRDLVGTLEQAGYRVIELGGAHSPANYGDTLHVMAEFQGMEMQAKIMRSDQSYFAYRMGAPGLSPVDFTFAVGSALWDWNATDVESKGIGASEETIVYLARHFGRAKKNVEVFTQLPSAQSLTIEEVRDGVKYWPREAFRRIRPESTVVVSRAPSLGRILDDVVGSKLDRILWLQDAWYPDLTAELAAEYRKVVVLTNWHADVMRVNHGVPSEKMALINNFLLSEQFSPEGAPKREPHHFVYASSPDRGLIPLLRLWPRVLETWPDATLAIFYGWEGCMKLGGMADAGWNSRYREARTEYTRLRYQAGIQDFGRVNHARLAREFQRASALAYPAMFDETGCNTAAKAKAAGAVPVVPPRAALGETAYSPFTQFVKLPMEAPKDFEQFDELVAKPFVAGLKAAVDVSEKDRRKMSEEAVEEYRIETMATKWAEVLKR